MGLLVVVDGSTEAFQPLPAYRLVNPTLGFVRCNRVGVSRCSSHNPGLVVEIVPPSPSSGGTIKTP